MLFDSIDSDIIIIAFTNIWIDRFAVYIAFVVKPFWSMPIAVVKHVRLINKFDENWQEIQKLFEKKRCYL